MLVTANKSACFQIGLNKFIYFDLSKIGKKINDAINNLVLTKRTGPNSGVAIFMNIKALPHKAPRVVKRIQYLIAIF